MAGFAFDPNFNFDDVNANFEVDPNNFGEGEGTNANRESTIYFGEGAVGDAGVVNPINHENDLFLGPGALMTNDNFDPTRPIDGENDPLMAVESRTAYDNPDTEQEQTQHQQVFPDRAPETNQVAANVSNVEEEDWFRLSDQEQDDAFHRLMEMSNEEFEEMMRDFPAEEIPTPGPSSATPYADSKKRVRLNEEGSASTSVGGAPSTPQQDFEPHQIHQIRQIREAKSRQGKAIEGLEKRVQDLTADLAKAQSEAQDAFENGRMIALLGVDGSWEAKEAQLRQDAQREHDQQIGAVRNFLEGQIAEKAKQLDQYRAEAEEYKTRVEGEAGKYKQAAEEEIEAHKAAVKAAEGAKNKAESGLSEKTRVLDLAKPYVESLEKKVSELEGLSGASKRDDNAQADLKRALENSQSYAVDLERKLANLKIEQSSKEAAQLQQLQQSATEDRKALEGRIKDLESTANKATKAEDKAIQAIKGLDEELRRLSGDLNEVQLALTAKTDELERARSAIEEMTEAPYPQQQRETQSIVGPVEQVDVEPSNPANAKTISAASSFTFVAAKELPQLQVKMRPVHPKKSQRKLRPQPQPHPQPQLKQEPEPEPELTTPSQLGMFSRHFYPPVPWNRPRRIHIHAEEAIRNRFRIPLDRVHAIASKLDQIEELQDGGGAADKASLIIAAELTGLSIRDLKVMRSLRMSLPSSSSNPRSVMRNAELELPMTLVDLLASENRPAIRALLDGASFPQSQASTDIARDTRCQGTQTETLLSEAEEVQEEEAVVQPGPKQSRWSRLGFGSLWKTLIFLCLLWFVLPLLLPLPWSSPVAWFFEDPDPNSGWLDYVPPPSPWSSLIPDFSGWPVISTIFGSLFEDQDLESKWCGTIPVG
ncbi:hypothetical protein MMC31_008054 [Peltigera leucophlebia]|nr:hypothetical protein [Peltigera leucophlebia]